MLTLAGLRNERRENINSRRPAHGLCCTAISNGPSGAGTVLASTFGTRQLTSDCGRNRCSGKDFGFVTISAVSRCSKLRVQRLSLLDQLVRPREQRRRDRQPKCLGGLDVDDGLDL